jgi:hypothetical protein
VSSPVSSPATQVRQVVLIRGWTDARAGGGCCSGEVRDSAPRAAGSPHGHDATDATDATDAVAAAYRRLREERPELDVQIVDAGNTLWLLPTVFRAVRRREGARAALRAALRANRAGAVIVDGAVVGDVVALGPDGVLRCCSAQVDGARDHRDAKAGSHRTGGDLLR